MKLKTRINRLAFFSVVYPKAEATLGDFLESLDRQTDRGFDLVLANDGLATMADWKARFPRLRICDFAAQGTPASIRLAGIERVAAGGYEGVVFGDCDDMFESNRVEECRRRLALHEIVFNDLHLVSSEGERIESGVLSRRYHNGQVLEEEEWLDKNAIGFGNAAVQVAILKDLNFPADLIAVDWYLFALLHHRGHHSVFTNETATRYRQHAGNTVGMKALDEAMLLRGVEVKMLHYRHLKEERPFYRERYDRYRNLLRRLRESPLFAREYIQMIKTDNIAHPLWWEQVRLMENTYESAVNAAR